MGDGGSIEWSDAMLTGVAEIDQQHRILVDTLSEVRTKLTDEAPASLFEQITRDVLAYAIYHFDTEERLMQQYGYAAAAPEEAAGHLDAHRRFSEQVVALRTEARLGKTGSRTALRQLLEGWLVGHILNTDQGLGQFIGAATSSPKSPSSRSH